MSLKLLKQSLDILDEASSGNKEASRSKKLVPKDRCPNSKRLPIKELPIKKRKNIVELRKEILPDKNKTNVNLKRLLALSKNTVSSNDAEKIIKRNNKGKSTFKKPRKSKEAKSIFTEEDFLAFEKEYFATNT